MLRPSPRSVYWRRRPAFCIRARSAALKREVKSLHIPELEPQAKRCPCVGSHSCTPSRERRACRIDSITPLAHRARCGDTFLKKVRAWVGWIDLKNTVCAALKRRAPVSEPSAR
jgi:hypothetical protein